jgi:general secretion pathway protein J
MPRRVNFLAAKTDGGFTLVEVMISLAIIGMISLMVFGVFRLGISAWERGDAHKDEFQKMRIVTQLISRQVKSIVPYKIKSQKAEGDYLAFEGKPRSLKFVSALSLRARQPEGFVYGVYEFKEGGSEGGQLILYEKRVLNRDFMEDDPKEDDAVPVLSDISEVKFEYYREEDLQKTKAAAWVDEWNTREEKELPKAVRMTLTQKKKDEKEREGKPLVIMASLPSNRFEDVRVSPGRRMIPGPMTPGAPMTPRPVAPLTPPGR